MVRPTRIRSIVLLFFAITAGCSSARYVSRGQEEGVIAMPVDNDLNREKAVEMMNAHFPNGYEIVHEYEEIVGTITTGNTHRHSNRTNTGKKVDLQEISAYASARHDNDMKGIHGTARQMDAYRPYSNKVRVSTNSYFRSQTRDKTEWRIRYRRQRKVLPTSADGTSISHLSVIRN